jgi:hypothetical protein
VRRVVRREAEENRVSAAVAVTSRIERDAGDAPGPFHEECRDRGGAFAAGMFDRRVGGDAEHARARRR